MIAVVRPGPVGFLFTAKEMRMDQVQPHIPVPVNQAQDDPRRPYEMVNVKWLERTRLDGYYGGLWFTDGITDPPVQRIVAEQFLESAGDQLFQILEIAKPENAPDKADKASSAGPAVTPPPVAPPRVLPSPATESDALRVLGLPMRARLEEVKARHAELVKQYPADSYPSEYVQITDAYRLLVGTERPTAPGRGGAVPAPVRPAAAVASDDGDDDGDDDASEAPPPPPPVRRPPAPRAG